MQCVGPKFDHPMGLHLKKLFRVAGYRTMGEKEPKIISKS
jgi:hypothetical protein